MKLISDIKVNDIAGEKVALLDLGNGKTRAVSFNSSSLYLWEELSKRQSFEVADVAALLKANYGIDDSTADKDAADWVCELQKNGLVD